MAADIQITVQMAPLRAIVDRSTATTEWGVIAPTDVLECGHIIFRPLGLGENPFVPSKAKRRRCWKCAA